MLGALVAFVLSPCLPPAQAQTRPEIISPKPDSVAVTIYRDPQRGQGGGMNLDYLNGFAVVTEKRTVSVPAGPSTIRFAGVAEGMVAVSAVVRGLPMGRDRLVRFYPGEVPLKPPERDFWSGSFFELPVFQPPKLDPSGISGVRTPSTS